MSFRMSFERGRTNLNEFSDEFLDGFSDEFLDELSDAFSDAFLDAFSNEFSKSKWTQKDFKKVVELLNFFNNE